MKVHRPDLKTGLVLPGGGARGAFQVGVLKALSELLPAKAASPFPVISGTSAGAINSVVLASKSRHFRVAVAELERVWGHFHSGQVFRTLLGHEHFSPIFYRPCGFRLIRFSLWLRVAFVIPQEFIQGRKQVLQHAGCL